MCNYSLFATVLYIQINIFQPWNLSVGGGVKYTHRLLVPYILVSLILSGPLSLPLLARIFYGRPAGLMGLSHMWFLPCFFVSIVLYNIISSFARKENIQFLIILILALCSVFLSYDSNVSILINGNLYHLTGWSTDSFQKQYYIGFPFTLNASLTGVVLIYMGRLVRKLFNRIDIAMSKLKVAVVLIICLGVGTICFLLNRNCLDNDFPYHLITMAHAIYGNYFLFLLTSIAFTVATLCISIFIDNKFTSKIGTQTMAIYAFHPFVLSCISVCLPFLPGAKGLIPSSIALIIIYFTIPLLRRIDSTLLGEIK